MRNMNLRAKLGVGFGIILLTVATLGVFSYVSVTRLDDLFTQTQERDAKLEKTNHIEIGIEKQTGAVRGFLLAGKEDLLTRDEEGRAQYLEALTFFQNTVRTDEGKRLLNEVVRRYDAFRALLDREIQARRANRSQEAETLAFSADAANLRKDLRTAVSDFEDYQRKKKEQANQQQDGIVISVKRLAIALPALALALGITVAWFSSRSLSRTVEAMSGTLHEVAQNNLAVADVEIRSRDEIGLASLALNDMKNNLREMIEAIAKTAEHLASATEELSASAAQQAQGSETQKDQAVVVATAMQEMVATVGQVSENSNRAAEASRKAAQTAQRGGAIVEDTLTKMHSIADGVRNTATKMTELGKASDQIGHIVGVIDDIADQTNLLALNAAIEAARAGEQGRGFAVVADEVRKLAERTTGATKEIAQMIKNIQGETRLAVTAMEAGTQQVEDGVKSTTQAGVSLKEIIQMVEQVGEMVNSIATAATEQSSVSEQINQNMDQIARLARESAVGSQESAKACQELSGLALDLQKMVSRFRLDDRSGRPGSTGHFRAAREGSGVEGLPVRSMSASAH